VLEHLLGSGGPGPGEACRKLLDLVFVGRRPTPHFRLCGRYVGVFLDEVPTQVRVLRGMPILGGVVRQGQEDKTRISYSSWILFRHSHAKFQLRLLAGSLRTSNFASSRHAELNG
jgi:hypothetical protein